MEGTSYRGLTCVEEGIHDYHEKPNLQKLWTSDKVQTCVLTKFFSWEKSKVKFSFS